MAKPTLHASNITSTNEWIFLARHLHHLERDYLEAAIAANSLDELRYYQGRISMLREFLKLPRELEKKEFLDAIDKREEQEFDKL